MPTEFSNLRCSRRRNLIQVSSLQTWEIQPSVETRSALPWHKGEAHLYKETVLVPDWFIFMQMGNPNLHSLIQIALFWLVRITCSYGTYWSLWSCFDWSNWSFWSCSDWSMQVFAHWLKYSSRNSFIRFGSDSRNIVQKAWQFSLRLFPDMQYMWEASVNNGC